LSVSYLQVIKSFTVMQVLIPLLLDSAVVVVIGYGFRFLKNKYTPKKKRSLVDNYFYTYRFFTIWFLFGMLFHLQLFTLDKTLAERWFYFPIVGLLGISGVVLEYFKINWKNKWIIILTVLLIIIFSTRTIIRSVDF